MNPKLSVIMSVYNQAQYLSQAVDSILSQTFSDFEFLILDDASTDSTPQILKSYHDRRITVLTHRRKFGLATDLNQLIRQSRGEYLARMDADDMAHPHRFELQLKFLTRHYQIAACGTAANLIDTSGKTIGKRRYPSHITSSILMRYNPLIHPSIIIRKTALDRLGNYDEALDGAEDYDLWLRFASHYQLANLDQVLLDYRINPHGVSWDQLKHTELQSIKARFKALTRYNYPLWQTIFLIKPILSYLIPDWIKKLLFNIK